MVSTRTQDGTINQAAKLPTQDTNAELPEEILIPTGPDPSIQQINRAAMRRNRNIAPLNLDPNERRTSILTGKRPTAAQLRQSQSKSPKSVRFEEAGQLPPTPRTPASSSGLKDPLEARLTPSTSPIGTLFPPPLSTSLPATPPLTPLTRRRSARLASQALPTSQDLQINMAGSNTFFPSTIIGAKETVGLSNIGRADKEVSEMEQILAEHEIHAPHLVGGVRKNLERARRNRAAIDESLEENWRVGEPNPIAKAIEARLKSLEWGLSTSTFAPETDNIQCAITGYKNGTIPYSNHFTLIYAGHIVDTAAQYSDIVQTRMARLDSYASQYGEGWLWYEPPLSIHPESQPHALLGMGLDRAIEWTNLGPYYIQQGYWKRDGYVKRLFGPNADYNSPREPHFFRDPNDPTIVYCQDQGPRLSFRSILDSGATYPSLHTEDLVKLGIDKDWYAAQSITGLETANGKVDVRVFELWVCVVRPDGSQLVNPNDPVWPGSHKYLGGLCPVTESTVPITYDMNGFEVTFRLSGMLPFLACYISSTPTRSKLWFGEDRNDVLGHYRMPGQKKWAIEIPVMPSGLPENYYDNPKIRFQHRGGEIIDEDFPNRNNASRVLIQRDTATETVIDSDPAAMQRFRPAAAPYVSSYVPPIGGGIPGIMPPGMPMP